MLSESTNEQIALKQKIQALQNERKNLLGKFHEESEIIKFLNERNENPDNLSSKNANEIADLRSLYLKLGVCENQLVHLQRILNSMESKEKFEELKRRIEEQQTTKTEVEKFAKIKSTGQFDAGS